MWQIIHSRAENFLKEDHGLFHALLWDSPYNLEPLLKRAQYKLSGYGDGSFQRQMRGFMNQTWDTDLAYKVAFWKAVTPHLHPGAFSLTFSHPRKQDLLTSAQRRANYLINSAMYNYTYGWREVPASLAWIYGSGKPTGTNLSKVLDNQAGAERDKKKVKMSRTSLSYAGQNHRAWMDRVDGEGYVEFNGDEPISPLAQIWDGWQYGNPLRPELEPIVVAQKPYAKGRTADSITQTGAGTMNIEAGKGFKASARFPGNLIVTHHPDCILKGMKSIKNISGSVTGDEPSEPGNKNTYNGGWGPERPPAPARGENGYEEVPDYTCAPGCAVARLEAEFGQKAHYFMQADWSFEIAERLMAANPVYYAGKVDEQERNIGCWNMPLSVRQRANPGGLANDPKWADTLQYNNHPTLKPIKLCTYLASLLLPPPEYAPRRILVLCSGTGSEMAGCLLAGWDEVIGVEMQPENGDSPNYVGMAEARLTEIEKWMRWGHTDIDVIVKAAYEALELERSGQLTMF